jgi:uncharacterized paraquat-inducible protein A
VNQSKTPHHTVTCPNCDAIVPAGPVCENCGQPLPQRKWYSLKGLNAAEIFLLVLGMIMLMIGLVAV